MNEHATEEEKFIILMIGLHEGHVALGDNLGEVPREISNQKFRQSSEGRDYARLKVGPDTRLRSKAQLS